MEECMRWKTFLSVLVCLCLGTSVVATEKSLPAGLQSLVDAEKKFAEKCAEKGIRDSFLMYFSDDVVTFGNGLRIGTDHLKKRIPAEPLRFRLLWLPVYGDISSAGDLGYLTGPALQQDSKGEQPDWRGYYFSIWTKNNGEWKVIVDFGVASPTAEFKAGAPFIPAAHEDTIMVTDQSASKSLSDVQAAFQARARDIGIGAAICEASSASVRYYRDGETPQLNLKDACEHVSRERRGYDLQHVAMSTSNDLGYAYGTYKAGSANAKAQPEGAYVNVWRFNGKKWKLVAAIDKVIKPQ
jgi:ketosteroid isomerase-like protein